MTVTIYKLVSSNGYSYVGSTTQSIKSRFAQHKYSAKINPGKYSSSLFDENSKVKIIILEICDIKNRFDREKYWLFKTKNTVNLCTPWQGPKDFKPYDYQLKIASENMKKRWVKNRKQVLNHVNAHKTKAFQKAASARSHELKYKRMPLKKVLCNSTSKVLGEFKTHNELAKILGIKSRKTIWRMLNGKGIFAGKYNVEVVR
jgi:predicted GIY-YIG superfamily endonuclease